MIYNDKSSLWSYTELDRLGKRSSLVRNTFSGKLMVLCVTDSGSYETFRKIKNLDCPNLMKVFDVRVEGENCLSLCEYVGGVTLEEAVQLHYFDSEAQVAATVAQLCDGLSALHGACIIHRDINPTNIMIDQCFIVKIIDYDIIRSVKKDKGRDTQVMGTPGFAAPEQFGFSQTDARADIYSCGVLLNYILTGALPNERLYRGSLSPTIQRCIEMDADNRFNSAEELKKELIGNRRKPYNKAVKQHINYRKLPGFRGNNTALKVLTGTLIVLYFLLLYSNINLAILFPEHALHRHIFGIAFFGFFSAIPYICFGDLFGISRLISKKNPFLGKKVLKVIGFISLILGVVFVYISNSV